MSPTELGKTGRNGGRPVGSFVMCVPIKRRGKLYGTVVRPALLYGSQCWAVKKSVEHRMVKLHYVGGAYCKVKIKNEFVK